MVASRPRAMTQTNAVRFRRGWFLGDGTGAGKGRQVAGILLDNWLKGRRRAVWISKSDKLIEDAQRDWSALGMERLLVTPLSRFRQGTPIRLEQGILFTTYATLRSDEREEKAFAGPADRRMVGRRFRRSDRLRREPCDAERRRRQGRARRSGASQQGRAGLRLQHALPNARVVYVSATGATTVHNLAYAQRLGLWGGEDFPFATRAEFVEAIEDGGVAAMEVLARDLKALGLYAARSLSYEGVEYELVEHQLTPEQIRIYDAYAGAFAIIHNNLDAAMQAANITGETGTLNAQAKSAARSAFESRQAALLRSSAHRMKTPSLIRSIERDLRDGHAAVIQIVSTGEALMERRLAEIPTEEWGDVQVDITPREYVLDYLAHTFPMQLYEPFTDGEGNLSSRPVFRDGQPVQCREAVARRDRLIEKLGFAAAGAWCARSDRPALRHRHGGRGHGPFAARSDPQGSTASSSRTAPAPPISPRPRPSWMTTSASSSSPMPAAPGAAIMPTLGPEPAPARPLSLGGRMEGRRRDPGPGPHQPHQPGAAAAVPADRHQREGREALPLARSRAGSTRWAPSPRASARPAARACSGPRTIWKATTARDALRQLYLLLVRGKVEGCSLQAFEDATGLKLMDANGIKDELPPITTFLNRLLALTIDLQNMLFTAFEQLLTARIEGAIASGTYDVGLETLTRRELRRHRSADDLHPSRHRRGDPSAHHHAGANAIVR